MSPAVRITTEAPPTAELLVVGAGVVGAATAFHAARAGLRPVVLERRRAPATLTTPASTGAFRLQFDNEEEYRLVRRSVEFFLNFEEATGQDVYDLAVRQQGYLWLTTSAAGVERQRRLVALQRGWGLDDVEHLDGDEARRRFPHVGPDVTGARYRAADGFIDPRALTMGLLAGSGAPVVVGVDVAGFRVSGDRVVGVETSAGPIDAQAVAVAAGPFAAPLLQHAGVTIPVETVPRHKVVLPDVPEVPAESPMTIDEDTGAHWRPALRGAFALFTDPETPPTPPTEDVPPDHDFAFRLLDPSSPVALARVAPFWRDVWERNRALWLLQSGQYVMTPDHRPLIGPAGPEGLYVNTGYSGHGIMASTAASELLVDVLRGRVEPDRNPFRLDRTFAERERDVL
ncbi:MAG: NAD(P)/FAD-dependent oxidoreductase [Nitriliruptorales bacterium]